MLMKADRVDQTGSARTSAIYPILLASIAVLVALVAFSEALLELVHRWIRQEEYSHGFLIPVIVAWLLWARRDAIVASIGRPSWTGPALILLAAAMHVVGKLSALYFLSQFGFIVRLIWHRAGAWRLFAAQSDISFQLFSCSSRSRFPTSLTPSFLSNFSSSHRSWGQTSSG